MLNYNIIKGSGKTHYQSSCSGRGRNISKHEIPKRVIVAVVRGAAHTARSGTLHRQIVKIVSCRNVRVPTTTTTTATIADFLPRRTEPRHFPVQPYRIVSLCDSYRAKIPCYTKISYFTRRVRRNDEHFSIPRARRVRMSL